MSEKGDTGKEDCGIREGEGRVDEGRRGRGRGGIQGRAGGQGRRMRGAVLKSDWHRSNPPLIFRKVKKTSLSFSLPFL